MTRASRGFSLVEQLVAVAVLTLGLLGAAALLLSSMRSQMSAARRLAAVSLLDELGERIRANAGAAEAYAYSSSSALPRMLDCPDAGCSPAERAETDLAQWLGRVTASLPAPELGPLATVEWVPAPDTATPARYAIALRWREAHVKGGDGALATEIMIAASGAGEPERGT